jgi:hypothetical protein
MQISQVLQNLVSCRYIPFITVQKCSSEQSCGWCKRVPLQAACCVVTITYGVTLTVSLFCSWFIQGQVIFYLQYIQTDCGTHSPPSGAEVKNEWSYTTSPTHASMAYIGVALSLHCLLSEFTALNFTCSLQHFVFLYHDFVLYLQNKWPNCCRYKRTVRIVQNSHVLAINYMWSIKLGMWEMTYAREEQDNKAV